jgi:hypothetical protein
LIYSKAHSLKALRPVRGVFLFARQLLAAKFFNKQYLSSKKGHPLPDDLSYLELPL